jgi:hypothetical protein
MNATPDTFGFDCVCLIKGVLWGWTGDLNARYGGAKYQSNGVPDIDETTMFNKCSDISTDFSHLEMGEAVWMKGHIGIYIGNGLAVECSPKWGDCVQITACNCSRKGYNRRDWTKHGKLPYVKYENTKPTASTAFGSVMLRNGNKGDTVKLVQNYLNLLGYNCGEADGDFGAKTQKAVIKYQKAMKLEADGIIGPMTMQSLYISLGTVTFLLKKSIFYNAQVVALQNLLNMLGYNCGKADGYYGDNTITGVTKFQ